MKKILILSSNTGEGHNSAGKAILEEAESRGIFGVRIDTLLFDFAWLQNEAQAASNAANEEYSPSRFACVGTRSALASFTVDSLPPLLAGSAGTHVLTLTE